MALCTFSIPLDDVSGRLGMASWVYQIPSLTGFTGCNLPLPQLNNGTNINMLRRPVPCSCPFLGAPRVFEIDDLESGKLEGGPQFKASNSVICKPFFTDLGELVLPGSSCIPVHHQRDFAKKVLSHRCRQVHDFCLRVTRLHNQTWEHLVF